MATERDYVLGTHEEELRRLGLQHRVWRPHVLDGWAEAGITVGKRIIDIGAGPGFATIDLAEIVGPTGAVVAVERSHNFVRALRDAADARGLQNIRSYGLDLMTDDLPKETFDFSWCRWVAAFVSDPALLLQKISSVLTKGSRAIFHEYAHYESWRCYPKLPHLEKFREYVIETWRQSGGEPDAARIILGLLRQHGFFLRSARPLIFCIRPADYMWQWPAQFIEVYLPRLLESGRIDKAFDEAVRAELQSAEANNSMMVTPLVLEIIAEKR